MARQFLFLVLLFWQVMARAQSPSPLLEQAFLQDPQSNLSLEQVLAADFKPYGGPLSLGFQRGVVWIRLQIDAAGEGLDPSSRQRIVRVGPNNLERIALYAQDGERWTRQVSGLFTPDASRECPDDMHCFTMQAAPSAVSSVYLRIEHRGYLSTQVEVLSPQALPHAVARRIRALTGSLVVALGLLAVGLGLLLIDRSVLLLVYCGFQLSVVLFIASNAGLLATVWPDLSGEQLSLVNSLLYVARVTMTGVLSWTVLHPHGPSRLHRRGGEVLLALCAVNGVLMLVGEVQLALKGSLLVLSMIPFWHLYGTLTAQGLPVKLRRVLIAGSLVYIGMLLLGLLLAFGEQPAVPRTGFIRQVADWRLNGLAVGALFFWITMMERSTQKRARADELEALRHQALEARARQSELDERSSLIDMLTHELKNPLGTIRFAVASLRPSVTGSHALQRIQSIDLSARRMDELIERVASFSKVERATSLSPVRAVDVDRLLQELLADVSRPQQWDLQVQPGAVLRCDRQLLWVILENLVSNADKYSAAGQAIRVDVAMEEDPAGPSGRALCLAISNAVDPDCVPDETSLFERYYRHSNVQGKAGMGLGLSVARSAARKVGGSLTYRHEGGRAIFTLRVPA